MSKPNHQFQVVFNKCMKTEKFLLMNKFTIDKNLIIDDEVAEPLRIVINLQKRMFFWCDSEGYVDFKRNLKETKNETIKTTTLKKLKACLN